MMQSLVKKLLDGGTVKVDVNHSLESLLSELSELGLPVDEQDCEVTLTTVRDPLDPVDILSRLSALQQPHKLEIHQYIDSTNDYLSRTFKAEGMSAICLAEYQTKGHGRRGGQWCSTYGKDLLGSIAWILPAQYRVTGVESLYIALSLATALEKLGLKQVGVKWPNDIYAAGRKIGGILIHHIVIEQKPTLIVGVGINLSRPLEEERNRLFVATSFEEQQVSCGRNEVAAGVIAGIFDGLLRAEPQLDEVMMLEWQQYDYLLGKNVTISQDREYSGAYQGIDQYGRLLLKTGDGMAKFSSGHITEIFV